MQNFKTKAVPRESVAINGAIKTVLHEIDRINVDGNVDGRLLTKEDVSLLYFRLDLVREESKQVT